MKNILIAINLDEGLYNFRAELITALIEKGFTVHLALPAGEFYDKLVTMGCIIHDTAMERRGTNPFKELSLIRSYYRILNKVKPKAVLTYTIKPNIYMGFLCRLKKIPYITTITGLGTAVEGKGLLQGFTRFLYKNALAGAKRIFFQNGENLELFNRLGITRGNAVLVPGSGVNLERFHLLPYPEGNNISFLFISRVMEEKGIDLYIYAAKRVREEYPDASFKVLGFLEEDYENKSSFEKAVLEGTIIYEGSVPDIRPFLREAECTIHPSFYPEGMSNVCLETAACGRAVITTDRPGCRDTVKDGISGFIVPERDGEALAKAVLKFISMDKELRKEMGLKGRKFVEKNFDRNIVINEMLKVLQ